MKVVVLFAPVDAVGPNIRSTTAQEGRLNFLLHAVADLLPTPSTIKNWGRRRAHHAHNVPQYCAHHIFTGCPKAPRGLIQVEA